MDVDGVRNREPEPIDVLVGAGMWPGGGRDRAGDDHCPAPDDSDDRDHAQPARRDRRAVAAGVAPRLEHDDDRERDHDERQQEVGHHGERVEVEDHRQAAERDLGDRAEERRERRTTDPRREPCHPAGGEPRDECHEDPPEGDDTIPELDDRVEVLRRKGRRAAPGPVVAAEPRSGQADERAGGDDEPERDDGRHGEPEKPVGRHGPAEPGWHSHARETPVPALTRPIAWSGRPAAAKVASTTARFSAGSVMRSPPAVCGS